MAAPPVLQALLVCDQVVQEVGTMKRSAIGIFTELLALRFPAVHASLAVYFAVTDAEGKYAIELELDDLERNQVVGGVRGIEMVARDKLAVTDFHLTFHNVQFPHPGKYEFRLLFNGHLAGSRTITLREMKTPQRPGAPPPPAHGQG